MQLKKLVFSYSGFRVKLYTHLKAIHLEYFLKVSVITIDHYPKRGQQLKVIIMLRNGSASWFFNESEHTNLFLEPSPSVPLFKPASSSTWPTTLPGKSLSIVITMGYTMDNGLWTMGY